MLPLTSHVMLTAKGSKLCPHLRMLSGELGDINYPLQSWGGQKKKEIKTCQYNTLTRQPFPKEQTSFYSWSDMLHPPKCFFGRSPLFFWLFIHSLAVWLCGTRWSCEPAEGMAGPLVFCPQREPNFFSSLTIWAGSRKGKFSPLTR